MVLGFENQNRYLVKYTLTSLNIYSQRRPHALLRHAKLSIWHRQAVEVTWLLYRSIGPLGSVQQKALFAYQQVGHTYNEVHECSRPNQDRPIKG